MYAVVNKNTKRLKKGFTSYEDARQWVRKQVRKLTPIRLSNQPFGTMDEFGFLIKRI